MQTKNDINYYACMGISIQLFSPPAQIYVNEYEFFPALCDWYLYKMVFQNILHKCEGKQVFSEIKYRI